METADTGTHEALDPYTLKFSLDGTTLRVASFCLGSCCKGTIELDPLDVVDLLSACRLMQLLPAMDGSPTPPVSSLLELRSDLVAGRDLVDWQDWLPARVGAAIFDGLIPPTVKRHLRRVRDAKWKVRIHFDFEEAGLLSVLPWELMRTAGFDPADLGWGLSRHTGVENKPVAIGRSGWTLLMVIGDVEQSQRSAWETLFVLLGRVRASLPADVQIRVACNPVALERLSPAFHRKWFGVDNIEHVSFATPHDLRQLLADSADVVHFVAHSHTSAGSNPFEGIDVRRLANELEAVRASGSAATDVLADLGSLLADEGRWAATGLRFEFTEAGGSSGDHPGFVPATDVRDWLRKNESLRLVIFESCLARDARLWMDPERALHTVGMSSVVPLGLGEDWAPQLYANLDHPSYAVAKARHAVGRHHRGILIYWSPGVSPLPLSERFADARMRYFQWVRTENADLHNGLLDPSLAVLQEYTPVPLTILSHEASVESPERVAETSLGELLGGYQGQGARVVILGGPGSGKTTTLRHLARRLAEGFGPSEHGDDRVPVLVDLSLSIFHGLRQPDHLIRAVASDDAGIHEWLVDRATNGKIVLLLDGLDELAAGSREDCVALLTAWADGEWGGCSFVVSSRIAEFDDCSGFRDPHGTSPWRCAVIGPLQRRQQMRLLEGYYRWSVVPASSPQEGGDVDLENAQKNACALLDVVDGAPDLQRLATSPLLLTLMAQLAENGGGAEQLGGKGKILPRTRREFLEASIRMLLESPGSGTEGDLFDQLVWLAADMTACMALQRPVDQCVDYVNGGPSATPHARLLDDMQGRGTDASRHVEVVRRLFGEGAKLAKTRLGSPPKALEASALFETRIHGRHWQRTGVYRRPELTDVRSGTGVSGASGWRFWHRSFQEFLTSEAIGRIGHELRTELFKNLFDATRYDDEMRSYWVEPLAFTLERSAGNVDGTIDSQAMKSQLVWLIEQENRLGLRVASVVRGANPLEVMNLSPGPDFGAQIDHSVGLVGGGGRGVRLLEQVAHRLAGPDGIYEVDEALRDLERISDEASVDARETRFRLLRNRGTPDAERFVSVPTRDGVGLWREVRPRTDIGACNFWITAVPITLEQFNGFSDLEALDKPASRPWWSIRAMSARGRTNTFVPAVVSWRVANAYCRWLSFHASELSRALGLPPSSGGFEFRLPTSGEWLHAASAGLHGRYHFGDDHAALRDYAVLEVSGSRGLASVASKRGRQGDREAGANDLGLFDVHGNVDEWCAGFHVDGLRPTRGGSYMSDHRGCRLSEIRGRRENKRYPDVGFRVVYAKPIEDLASVPRQE